MFWGLITSGLEALLRIGDALGLSGARWEWKKQAWRAALEARIAATGERGGATPRICRSCTSLVEAEAKTCHSCGQRVSSRPRGLTLVLTGLIPPGWISVTTAVLLVNILLFVLMLVVSGPGPQRGLFNAFAPRIDTLVNFGAKWNVLVTNGQVWRLVTATYLHGGLIHILFNSIALVNLGPLIEGGFGGRKFFLIYSVTGIAAFTVSTLFGSGVPSVGASGSIFGLIGFAVVYGRFRAGPVGRMISDQLMRWVFLGVLMLFVPGIDHAAHFGGFVSGAALSLVVDIGEPRTVAGELRLRVLTATAVVVTVGAFLAVALSYPTIPPGIIR